MQRVLTLSVLVLLLVGNGYCDSDVQAGLLGQDLLTASLLALNEDGLESQDINDPFDMEGFGPDKWYFEAYGSGAIEFSGGNDAYSGHAGVGFFFHEQFSFSIIGAAGYMSVPSNDDSQYVGFDLLPRWHFAKWDQLRLFVEVGAGLHYAFPERFPENGSHFNFRSHAGMGVLYQLTEQVYLLGGANYLHISNANLVSPNVGWDGIEGYFGVVMPF